MYSPLALLADVVESGAKFPTLFQIDNSVLQSRKPGMYGRFSADLKSIDRKVRIKYGTIFLGEKLQRQAPHSAQRWRCCTTSCTDRALDTSLGDGWVKIYLRDKTH